jgi:hypothetical protein
MQKSANKKKNRAMIATASLSCLALLAGCGPREETAPVQVVKKTTIEKVPEKKPETVIVQPAPKPASRPAPKTKSETNVTVEVKPSPGTTLPEPAPIPEPATKKTSPPSTPAAEPPKAPKPKPKNSSSPPASSAKPAAKKPDTAKPTPSQKLQVRAEVVATSKMPDPKTVPYKDALVFTKYKVLDVKSGEYQGKEILVAQWGMKNKKLQPAARRKVGEVQTLSLEPLSKRPDLESIMRNDDIGEYDLEPYFAE